MLETHTDMGILHENNGEYSKALSCYEKCIPFDLKAWGRPQLNKGNCGVNYRNERKIKVVSKANVC